MFSFSDPSPKVIECDVAMGEMVEKYHDKYMIVIPSYGGKRDDVYGDIVAIFSPSEYLKLQKPTRLFPKYVLWEGIDIMKEGLSSGFYI